MTDFSSVLYSTRVPSFPSDYEVRVKEFGLASPNEIKEALSDVDTILMDVRTPEEIEVDGRITQYDNTNKVVQTICTPTECRDLSSGPEQVLGTDRKDVTIVVHCKIGKRAARAKSTLIENGYTGKILNAGGFDDLKAILGQ